jgi:hypothetical protein
MTSLAYRLQENGLQTRLEIFPTDSVSSRSRHVYVDTVFVLIRAAERLFKFPLSQPPSSTLRTNLPAQIGLQTMTQNDILILQPATEMSNTGPNTDDQANNASCFTQNAPAHPEALSTGSGREYILMCSDEKQWLTTREDLDVSEIKSDCQLFSSFRSRIHARKSRLGRLASFKTIGRISFVKVRITSTSLRLV